MIRVNGIPLTVGERVTCKRAEEAYGSNYGMDKGTVILFRPGDVGIVKTVDTPAVIGRRPYFACVDFSWNGQIRRVGLFPDNIARL
jgi:hypothetical protein